MAFPKKVGQSGQVVHTDINEAMLSTWHANRLLDAGIAVPTLVCDAVEASPFRATTSTVGERRLRAAQHDAQRPCAGRDDTGCCNLAAGCWCWSSPGCQAAPEKAYDWYSFQVLPRLGTSGCRR